MKWPCLLRTQYGLRGSAMDRAKWAPQAPWRPVLCSDCAFGQLKAAARRCRRPAGPESGSIDGHEPEELACEQRCRACEAAAGYERLLRRAAPSHVDTKGDMCGVVLSLEYKAQQIPFCNVRGQLDP